MSDEYGPQTRAAILRMVRAAAAAHPELSQHFNPTEWIDRPRCTCTNPSGDNPLGHSHSCPRRAWLEEDTGIPPGYHLRETPDGSELVPTAEPRQPHGAPA